MWRRLVAMAGSVLVAGCALVLVAPVRASASPVGTLPAPPAPAAVPTPADKTGVPAFAIASLLGNVLPQARATQTLTYTLAQWEAGDSTVLAGLAQLHDVAGFVPGFKLGEKVGGWLVDLFGRERSPNLQPNMDIPATAPGWLGGSDGVCQTGRVFFCVRAGLREGGAGGQFVDGFPTVKSGDPAASLVVELSLVGGGITTGATGDYPGVVAVPVVFNTGNGRLAACGGLPLIGRPVRINAGTAVALIDQPGVTSWSAQVTLGQVVGQTCGSYGYDRIVGVAVRGYEGPGSPYGEPDPARFWPDASVYGGSGAVWFGTPPASQGYQAWYVASDLPGSPAGSTPDPERRWLSVAHCTAGGDATAESSGFHETDAEFPAWPGIPACGAGDTMVGWEVQEIVPSDRTRDRVVQSWTAPPEYVEFLDDRPSECLGGAQCVTTLWKVRPDGSRLDCFAAPDECAQWATDPNRSSTYVCTYGPAGAAGTDVGLSGCYHYGPTFDREKRARGIAVSDPAKDPGVGDTIENEPIAPTLPEPAQGDACCPSGWGVLNPVSWVLMPVKCALVWAFVPSESAVQGVRDRVRVAYAATSLAEWGDALAGVGQFPITPGGCEGPGWTLPEMLGGAEIHPLSSCTEPAATLAGAFRALGSLAVVWMCGASVLRHLAAGFGVSLDWGRRE